MDASIKKKFLYAGKGKIRETQAAAQDDAQLLSSISFFLFHRLDFERYPGLPHPDHSHNVVHILVSPQR